MVKLHVWDTGDSSVGIGSNQAEIEMSLDDGTPEENAENIAHAKEDLGQRARHGHDAGRGLVRRHLTGPPIPGWPGGRNLRDKPE